MKYRVSVVVRAPKSGPARYTQVTTVEQAAQKTRHKADTGSGWYEWLARIGLAAKGISFVILAILALKLALGDGGKATSRQGRSRRSRTNGSERSS